MSREKINSLNTEDRQEEIINHILKLHNKNEPLDMDVTYSKGVFYKNGKVEDPKLKFDLKPVTDDTVQASSNNLPLEDSSIQATMFDPPFIISGKLKADSKEGSNIIAKRFSSYENYDQLKEHYSTTLKELYRVTKDKGIVIIKCQNTISSGKQHFTHFFVLQEAMKYGFYPKDEFILASKSKITSFGKVNKETGKLEGGRWKNQLHAMKTHSFFLVLEKRKPRVDYTFDNVVSNETRIFDNPSKPWNYRTTDAR